MIIYFQRSAFLSQLFPNIDIENDQQLEQALKNYYYFDGCSSKLNVCDDNIEIDFPSELFEKDAIGFNKASNLCTKGEFAEARPVLEQLIQKNPTVSEYYRCLAQTFEGAGQHETAIDILREALRWDPKNHLALTQMGNIFLGIFNDIETALTFFDQVMEAVPENYLALNNIGETFLQSGKLHIAERYLGKAHQINPKYPNNLLALGLLKLQNLELYKAFRYATETLKNEEETEGQVYHTALKLALDSAQLMVKQHGGQDTIDDFIKEIETLTGIEIKV